MKSITRSAALFVLITFGMQATGVASVGSKNATCQDDEARKTRSESAHTRSGVSARAAIDETPIRAEPNPMSAIIATLHEGDPVDIVDSNNGWYRVALPASQGKLRVGFVLMRLTEIVDADGTSPTDSPQAPATDRPVRPTVQGPAIPPVPMPVQRRPNKAAQREQKLKAKADALQAQRDQKLAEREQKVAQREQKLKAKVDALQAELDALTNSRK